MATVQKEHMLSAGSLSRLNYFYGQLLTERDLRAEQRYHLLLQRSFQREAFGTGTVAGLAVSDEKAGADAPEGAVYVRAGLALDPEGRELLVEEDVCITVADAALTPAGASWADGTDDGTIATSIETTFGLSFEASDVASLRGQLEPLGFTVGTPSELAAVLNRIEAPAAPPGAGELAAGETPVDYVFALLVGTTYIGLRYDEKGSDPTPAIVEASCCGDQACFPSRLTEGAVLVTADAPFPAVADPYGEARLALETCFLVDEQDPAANLTELRHRCLECLCGYLKGAWRGLPEVEQPCGTSAPPVVSLARVVWDRYTSESSRILDIDDCNFRLLAPGVPAVRALAEVLTQCHDPLPDVPILGRIVEVEPAFGETLAAGGTPPEIRFTCDAELQPPSTGVTARFYPDDTASTAPDPTVSVGPDGSDARVIVVTFTADWPNEPGQLRLELDGSAFNTTLAGGAGPQLDADPNPLTRLPSGNGQPGGVYTTVYRVE